MQKGGIYIDRPGVHIITAVIGFGVLSLAWAIAQLGWAAGPAVLLAFSFITYFTSSLLADCYRSLDPLTGKRNLTFVDIVRPNFSHMAVVVKPLPVFLVLSLLCMAMSLPAAHSARLMQSERDNFHGGSDDFSSVEKENLEADARYSNCWQFEPTSVPTSPTLSNYVYVQCWPLAPTPAPTPSAPINDEKEKSEDGAIYLQCRLLAPTPTPTSSTPINDDNKEKEKPKDDAMNLQCWLLATKPTATSLAHINDEKRDNPKLLFFCGYPCCGFKIHGQCKRCCPKGVLHPPSPTTHVEEAGNGGSDGHGGGD